MLGDRLLIGRCISNVASRGSPNSPKREEWFLFLLIASALLLIVHSQAYGATSIPGTDASGQLQAAGTLLRLVDSVLFSWGARIFAGICIISAGWNLKEQRFAMAILCVVAAVILGTAPTWVKNIFAIGGGDDIFSQYVTQSSGAMDA